MMEGLILIKHIRDALDEPNRPVLMEIERRRPGFRPEQARLIIGLWVIDAILILGLLMGLQLYF
jgi:hypothetical protein